MSITLQDMRTALSGQRKADEAIFWFCHAWHRGPDSALYRIMSQTDFHPRLNSQKQIENDPEILYCFDVLGRLIRLNPSAQAAPYLPIRIGTLKENDIVVHTTPRTFVCIEAGWPCRVYTWHGELGVACAEGPHGASFHPFEPDPKRSGFIKGFVR